MPHLSVFFLTLNGWVEVGSLERTLAIYRKFVEDGWHVTFYTYEPVLNSDIGFAVELDCYSPRFLRKRLKFLYQAVMPLLYFFKGRKTSLIITNHLNYGSSAILAGRLWGAKVIARCGMVFGESVETLRKSGKSARKKLRYEKKMFKGADKCMVPTKELADWVAENYGIERSKIEVVPNYVNTNLFKPDAKAQKETDVICVGRLVPKKRFHLLLEALTGTGIKIHIIGQGPLHRQLNDLAEKNDVALTMTRRIENNLLPWYFNRSKIYVNVAEWEGHPKALIEAMACGCACVGARSAGIENLIIDGQTGILVDPDPKQIHRVIERLLNDDELRKHLCKNARDYAVEHFSLDTVFEQYNKVFNELSRK